MDPGGRKTPSRVHIPPSSRDTEHEMRKRKMAAKSQRQTFVSPGSTRDRTTKEFIAAGSH